MAKKNQTPKVITALDLKPRDSNVLAMIGKARTFQNKARNAKSDKVGRKAKHKERF